MRRVSIALVFIISIILQTTILPLWNIRGVIPDLLLVLVIFSALFNGPIVGGLVGMAVGLMQDMLGGHYLGLWVLSFFCVGYLMGHLERRVNLDNIIVAFFLVLMGSLAANAVYLLGQSMLSASMLGMHLFWRVSAIGSLYDACLAALLFKPLNILFGDSVPRRVEIVQSGKIIYR